MVSIDNKCKGDLDKVKKCSQVELLNWLEPPTGILEGHGFELRKFIF